MKHRIGYISYDRDDGYDYGNRRGNNGRFRSEYTRDSEYDGRRNGRMQRSERNRDERYREPEYRKERQYGGYVNRKNNSYADDRDSRSGNDSRDGYD